MGAFPFMHGQVVLVAKKNVVSGLFLQKICDTNCVTKDGIHRFLDGFVCHFKKSGRIRWFSATWMKHTVQIGFYAFGLPNPREAFGVRKFQGIICFSCVIVDLFPLVSVVDICKVDSRRCNMLRKQPTAAELCLSTL